MRTGKLIGNTIDRIIIELRTRIGDPTLRITDVLKESGYAPDYIRQQFKRIIGISPNKYLTKIRMERAQVLIDTYHTTRPLTEIAESCGYVDYITFSKVFHQYTGIAPAIYRKLKAPQA